MQVEKIYVYPIKSLRGVDVQKATVTKFGFAYDRRFMLLKAEKGENGETTHKNMAVAHFNELVRFFPEFIDESLPSRPDEDDHSKIRVTYHPVDGSDSKIIEIPLVPDVNNLKSLKVDMHKSPTKAHTMPSKYNEWFSSCLGYEAILVYLGTNRRKVLMSTDGNRRTPYPAVDETKGLSSQTNGSTSTWLASLSSAATSLTTNILGTSNPTPEITFADVAPFLIVSRKSMEDVDSNLSSSTHFDITKFRPNIIISGAASPWEEDFWGELSISPPSPPTPSSSLITFKCESNCGRCRSINIDYDTGKQGEGEEGKMLKKLSVGRRVDPGMKYNPIFGRYSFLKGGNGDGRLVSVGDLVGVGRWNKERTRFDWEGLCTK